MWKFHTIARTGEPGGDTWGTIPDTMRAGGDTWIAGSYDPDLDLIYWGIAQAKPWMPASRGNKVSDAALYTASTVALRPDDGSLAWHFQHTPGETLDLDEVFEKVLVDIGPEKALFTIGKAGILWKIERKTGKFMGFKETVLQNIFTKIDPERGIPTYRQDIIDQKLDEWLTVCPSTEGGHNWQAMSYHQPTQHAAHPAQPVVHGNCRAQDGVRRGFRRHVGRPPLLRDAGLRRQRRQDRGDRCDDDEGSVEP